MDQFGGTHDGGIFFFAQRDGGLVFHFHDFAGMDDAHPMVAKTAFGQGGMNVSLIADKVEGGNFIIAFQRPFGTGNDDPATVVATHDIHCDSHSWIKNAEKFPRRQAG